MSSRGTFHDEMSPSECGARECYAEQIVNVNSPPNLVEPSLELDRVVIWRWRGVSLRGQRRPNRGGGGSSSDGPRRRARMMAILGGGGEAHDARR